LALEKSSFRSNDHRPLRHPSPQRGATAGDQEGKIFAGYHGLGVNMIGSCEFLQSNFF